MVIIHISDKELISQIHKEVLEKLEEITIQKKNKYRSGTDGLLNKKY